MITVVIPTHKPKQLENTLNSIFASKTLLVKEIIVVENGSKTFGSHVNYDITYLQQKEADANKARNYGWQSSNTEYVLFTDDDITMDKDYFTRLEEILISTSPNLIGGSVKLVEPKPFWIRGIFSKMLAELNWELWIPGSSGYVMNLSRAQGHWLVGASMCLKRSFLEEHHGWDERFGYKGSDSYPNDEHHLLDKSEVFQYSPLLKMTHNIEHRYNMEYMVDRFRRQGVVDCRYYAESEPDRARFISSHAFHRIENLVSFNEIQEIRQELKNEDQTQEYIQKYVKAKQSYLNGFLGEIDNVYK